VSARSAFPLAPRLKRLATIFRSHGSAFVRDDRGAATIEVALTSLFMVYSVMNVTDLSIYAYARMQVQNAAQMGAQAAYETCGSNDVPATSKCTGLSAAVTRGVQSTSLGTSVTLVSGSPAEGYYCINSSNVLQYMSSYTSRPVDCSGAGTPSLKPADYIKVDTQYTFSPIFPNNTTVGSLLNTQVTGTAIIRME
jgi:Flp pilus assembly protein TadG